ncbi:hypothetical protein FNYG_05977 [Fusarium nygamai]|uniref:NACHT-NTPase and P-loop NTPases N-terminal domain-containing protein n=1 Tax=Gibberella nygamai TaxID=42673 RepID=A0A2K0WDN7_GIBNY|nr:hypothetical protein FNYG_05977 [Fusarium nygamai]
MSGIEVVGLVSAIVGIVEAIGKVSKTLRDAKDIPRAFNEVAERLPLVRDTLQSVESHISHATEDGVYEAMKKVLENCREKAEQLQEIFRAVAPSERISRIKRYSLAVRRLGKGSLVEILAKGMMEDAHALVLAHSAQAATESQVMELSEAIRELSTIEASLPDESAASQMHYGSGDNIAGSKYGGNHTEFSGSGTAYFAPVTQNGMA